MKITYMCGILILLLIVPVTRLIASEKQEEVPTRTTVLESTTVKLPEGGNLNKTRIKSGAFFEENTYALSDLSEAGQKILREFTEQFLAAEAEYAKQVPGLSIIATINTTCYSNQTDFPEDSEFVKILTKDTTLQIPQQDPERRQFLNQRLSEFRAETLTAYLRQLLSEHDRKDRTLRIRYCAEGKGEDRSEEQIALERDSSEEKSLKPQTYSISAELKFNLRGPRVSHPTDIILYEVIEE